MRNRVLIPGVNALSRSASAANKRRNLHSKKGSKGKKVEKKAAVVKLEKRAEPKWYSADDASNKLFSRKNRAKPTKLRKSISPGTILIVLAGRFRGKRVIFIKQLDSGLLLVTGPYKINGVPLRRLNQAYVIATSTKIDVSKVDVSKINDDFFKKVATDDKPKKKDGADFFEESVKKKAINPKRVEEQKRVDGAILSVVRANKEIKAYLGAKFSLTKGQHPHSLKF